MHTSTWSVAKRLPLGSIRSRRGYHWYVVMTVCIGAFMAALDASIINIALPTFHRMFHARMHTIEWISLVYLLTLAALIVVFGRLADMIGRRWMYTYGFLVFAGSSLMCGLSSSLAMLLIFRGVQAVGAGMLQANSVAIITAATPAHARGKAIGIQASAQGVGLSLGPAIGGALISFLNWKWIFLVNLPVGLIGSLLGLLILPVDKKPSRREKFDVPGAVTLAIALVSFIYILNMGLKEGWTSIGLILCYVCGALGLGAFLWIERRSVSPMVDLNLFKTRIFSLGNLSGMIAFAVMYSVMLLGPFYLEGLKGLTPFVSGLYMTAIPIGMTLFTPLAGIIADRRGAKLPSIVGMAMAVLGCILLALVRAGSAETLLVMGLLLVGIGIGLFTPPNNSSVMGSVPSHRLGVAGGVLNMSRSLGMGLGVTFGGLVYQLFITLQGALTEYTATPAQMIFAFHAAYLVTGALACAGLVLAACIRANEAK